MKTPKYFHLEESTVKKSKQYCEQTNKKEIEVVEAALNHFIDNDDNVKDALTIKLEAICEQTMEKMIKEKIRPVLLRIRSAANNSDLYTQVLVELMNHQFRDLDKESLLTTNKRISPAIGKAIKVSRERIHNARVKKLEREKKARKK
ncbi:hypothetical protein [Heyndrickxia ginsengihumi]|uniref:hypothetical protein n=1 Tax=Heyndrickxia ginsengihumi TaxID=363870 RepID=UPI000471F658|nr:hypothetical protein [Heyndrickxia ginsengihumi]